MLNACQRKEEPQDLEKEREDLNSILSRKVDRFYAKSVCVCVCVCAHMCDKGGEGRATRLSIFNT